MKEQKFKVCVNVGNNPFFYKGYILEESNDYILIEDFKAGEIKLSKNAVISVQKVDY